MGLFNSKKKASNQSSIKPVPAFYSDCVADFHNEALKYGIAKRGLIFIPELMPIGENIALRFLQNRVLPTKCNGNQGYYYYLIMCTCIDAGICLATRWHEQFSTLNQFADEIMLKGPTDGAALRKMHFAGEVMDWQGDFFPRVSIRLMAMLEPYWKLSDSRDYILKAMVAAYQLGVSMILEKFGY